MSYQTSIIKKVGLLPGKTLAILGGVHGNERVGVETLDKLNESLDVKSGVVYLIYANPAAIEANVRALNKNLNRVLYRGNVGDSYEDDRARELMKILDTCDAILDIHSYNSKDGVQYAICESNGLEIIKKMDFPIVVEGFTRIHDRSVDGYMNKIGKIGVCIECGPVGETSKYLPLAIKSAYQFLQYFAVIDPVVDYDKVIQKEYRIDRLLYKMSSNFRFAKNFKDFEMLSSNQPFAYDGGTPLVAGDKEYIIFPRPDVEIGGEVCIIALAK